MDVNKVMLVGGTHGNELAGIYLVRKWRQHPELIQRPGFHTDTLIANARAHEQMRRYLDVDLNRCFTPADLANADLAAYEHNRAKVIHQHLGPKHQPAVDVAIDLHTTTANMGATLILPNAQPYTLRMAAYAQQAVPELIIYNEQLAEDDNHFLCSCARHGVMIEVGPTPQGLVRADVLELTERVAYALLDFIAAEQAQETGPLPEQIMAYQFVDKVPFPTTEDGLPDGYIHADLQDCDFIPLQPGVPLFRRLNGEVVRYQGEADLYPCFINEAAYYDKADGLSLMQQVVLPVPQPAQPG